ncbi:LysR family transcriptional regulator [Ahrensia sp. R2A130]|uniref:LysR family transcriptional regulator n=1 Tax=Ahrensia sp. R2A130 TaxID=744979 RepID=UPI0001E08C15|nr:LysR family transcriptional regulator [Ahrensia sp. R2A130]EFL90548.1 LysR family transcriptional regulator [Ahrensia sp. R2A130]
MTEQIQTPLIELDLLRTVVAIADTGNFSAASEAVFRTPSAISMQVKRIEELLGRQIFIREARHVSLNEDGETLVTHARRMLAMNADTVSKFVSPEMSGMVRLGAIDHAVDRFLPAVLRDFAKTHPQIRVDVTVENSEPQYEAFRRSELDIVIITCQNDGNDSRKVEPLFKEAMVWAGLKGGIAAERVPLPVSVWEQTCVWRENALEELEAKNRDYCITFKSAHLAGQKAGLRADLAIAPLPLSSCDGEIVPLDARHNLPELDHYTMGMMVRADAESEVLAVADALRANAANTIGWRPQETAMGAPNVIERVA